MTSCLEFVFASFRELTGSNGIYSEVSLLTKIEVKVFDNIFFRIDDTSIMIHVMMI